jgi:uncharacterized protein with FMN-binding domain
MLETYERYSKRKLAATVLAVMVIAGSVVFADALKSGKFSDEIAEHTATFTSSPTSSQTTATPVATTATTTTTSTSSGVSGYKDGTYTASSGYYVPSGNESIQVSLTLSGGTITNVSIVNSEGDRDSAAFQRDFTASYKSYVVGKKISSLQLGVIAGASDTTQGFNDALSQIASQAQA